MAKLRIPPTYPVTPEDLISFRNLLFSDVTGVGEQRKQLAALLGKNPLSIWRYETGSKISDAIVLRRALVNICDERGITLTPRLRYGRKE